MLVSSNFRLVVILLILILVLTLRFYQVLAKPQPEIDSQIKIRGNVSQEPVILGQSQYLSVDQFRIRTKIFPQYHYGEVLEITGTVGEKMLISYPEIKKLGQEKSLVSNILTFRRFLLSQSAKIWPQPEAGLLTGIVLGQDTITANFRQVLINTGTIHIVVVSGQNVAMLAGAITTTFGKIFKKRTVSLFVVGAIIFYTILTGFQPPTVRAAVMGILTFTAKLTGRQNWGFWALGMAAFLLLLIDPNLVFNISFQLSFAATAGILFAEPTISAIFKKFPKFVKESLSVTLAAWIFTLPLIVFYFSQFTPVTPFSNLLVLPLIPFLMVVGATSLVIASVNLFLGKILAVAPFVAASYFTFVTENLAKIPFATFKLPQINIFLMAAFYVFVILTISWTRRKFSADN